MTPPAIRGVYEVVIRVSDLDRAERFYRDVLGLELGLKDPNRPMSFWRVAGCDGMLVLQQDDGEWPKQHFAFRVEESDLENAKKLLEERGVSTHGPVHHEWMPAKSLYFADPDGHELEFCAPL
jgi:catechol 2,3-dioxygenase-like lactoylglutathione lyase family enzyme